ncbi:MAG: Cof-type HAD-IIB family hydrolase [Sphaerochaetaceae bacterium]
MFECKLICTDIDGTLLDTNHQISARTKEAIHKARHKGIIVALVSGRISSSLTLIQQELEITGPLGCFNGSLVLNEDGNELEAHPIRKEQCNSVLAYLSQTELEYFVFTNESWYMNEKNAWYDIEVQASRTEGRIMKLDLLCDFLNEGERPFKLLAMHHDPAYMKLQETCIRERFGTSLNVFSSSPRYIEIFARGVDKGHAVRSLCESYGVNPGTVMAVGDYYNDIGMFRAAGYAVAMGNAPDAVKAQAQAHTSSNDKDGLALAIEAIL